MKKIVKKYRIPWLLTLLLVSGLIFLNFNNLESRNASLANAISKSDSLGVSSSPFRLFNLKNDLSLKEQITAFIDANHKASGKDTTDTLTLGISKKNKPAYSNVGPNNKYKQLKTNSLLNNQAVIQVGYSNYAGHFILNSCMSDLIIRSIGNQNTAVQNILNGNNNSLVVTQNGSFNTVYQNNFSGNTLGNLTNMININSILQTGYNNWIISSQLGQNNSINTDQNGDSNRVSIKQNGNNNETIVRQSGNKNTVKINQN